MLLGHPAALKVRGFSLAEAKPLVSLLSVAAEVSNLVAMSQQAYLMLKSKAKL